MNSEDLDPCFDDNLRNAYTGNEYEGDHEEYSRQNLEQLPPQLLQEATTITSLHFTHNLLKQLPAEISTFVNLVKVDLSNNNIYTIHADICKLNKLKMFSCQNNHLTTDSFPKDFGLLTSLEYLNISSNQLTHIPPQIFDMTNLRRLYLGNNQITHASPQIDRLSRLEVLYLGGNQLTSVPSQLGSLKRLTYLILADNHLSYLPNSLSSLRNLKFLSLHNNSLSTLPPAITKLNLLVMSLRDNPLVLKFAEHLTYEAPSLMELSARVVKVKNIKVTADDLPSNLLTYLSSASHCVNPKCKGVYFSSRVEQIKFVDFCGLYRLPLLHYLCTPQCSEQPSVPYSPSSSESESDDENSNGALRRRVSKVLLG